MVISTDPVNCSICGLTIDGGTMIGTGDGSGNSFAHGDCYRARELTLVREELADYERLFDLQWAADQRAIKLWQAEDPEGRKLRWPDRANLVVWLLEEADRYREKYGEL